MILQLSVPVEALLRSVARLAGLLVFAGFLSAGVSVLYRWYVRERVPSGLALLVALAGVAVVLNTTPLLAAEIAADGDAVEIVDALSNIVAFAGSAGAAFAGIHVGDHLAVNMNAAGGTGDVDADVSEIVQTVGRVTSIQLPEEIADIVGYDPVPEATKETLAGRRFLFPRRLTKAELRERLVSRLKTDYGVGHVDVEFGDDGAIRFLAVGSRAAGIGPTLPPATNAVAIRADPAHAASAGDLVQVWETGPMRRVLTGELRGVAGDVVTVAIDAADTPKLDPTERYKLVTLPVQNRPDREFASLLRAADETLATVTVEAGSDLDGVALDALGVTVAAITREDEAPEPLPARSRTLQAGDVLYAVATPELLRKLEDAAKGVGSSGGSIVSSAPSRPAGSAPETPDRDSTPADPDSRRADAAPDPANPEQGSAETEETAGDARDESGRADDGASESSAPASDAPGPDGDAPSPADDDSGSTGDVPEREPGQDSVAAGSDEESEGSVPGGDAFPDTGDLPGMDQDVEMPSLTDEPSDHAGEDRDGAGDGRTDAESGDADLPASDDGAGPDDAGNDGPDGGLDALDPDGANGDAPAAEDDFAEFDSDESFDELSTDELLGDTETDDLLDAEPADTFDDGRTDERADDAADDDAADDDAADDDESVPFTPLDVGDEDPLSDPLTEGRDDGDDGENSDSERGD